MNIHDFISPAGMKRLITALFIVVAVLVVIFRRHYMRKIKPPLRIRYKMWFSGSLKMTVTISNKSSMIVEIAPPVLEFRQPRMKRRRFKVVTPSDRNLFPLGLAPLTSYDFFVDFTRFYEPEPQLRLYRKIAIRAEDRTGKLIIKRLAKIEIPK